MTLSDKMIELATSGIAKLLETEKRMNKTYREKGDVIHGLLIASITKLHVLVVSAPGAAKSVVANRFVRAFRHYHASNGKTHFRKLMSAALPPDELFGMIDIPLYEKTGTARRKVDGYMPTARTVVLDEFFRGNDSVNNTLLDQLDEQRMFRNGDTDLKVPLEFCVALSNGWYEDDQRALADRFPLRYVSSYIAEKGSRFSMWRDRVNSATCDIDDIDITDEELEAVHKMWSQVEVSDGSFEVLNVICEEFKKEGLQPSDRLTNYCIDLIRAEALLNGRTSVETEDFAILQHVLWQEPDAKEINKAKQIVLRVATPMMDDINTAVDSAKKQLDKARKNISNLHPNASDQERMMVAADERNEIENITTGLRNRAQEVSPESKEGKHLARSLKRVSGYKDKLLEATYRMDVGKLRGLQDAIEDITGGS